LSAQEKIKNSLEEFHKGSKDLNIKATVAAEAQLTRMVELGTKIGVLGTPAIFIVEKNSNKLVGEIGGGANIPDIDSYVKKDKE